MSLQLVDVPENDGGFKHYEKGLYTTVGVTGAAVVPMLSNPGEFLSVGVPVD